MAQTEVQAPGEFIALEKSGERSRENIVIKAATGVVPSGRMVGALTTTSTSAAKSGGNTGNGTMGAITTVPNTRPGVYTLRIITPQANAGIFEFRDPSGGLL